VSTSSSCILCDIVRGDAPASFVDRDDLVSAFLDIRPVHRGHTLVVPNDHTELIGDVPEAVRDRLFRVGVDIAGAIRRAGLGAEGIDLFLADGEAAGQEVPHAHLHVLPRSRGDGVTIDAAAWREPSPARVELNRHADAIATALRG
jgi:histidine triad (HIT) family protein